MRLQARLQATVYKDFLYNIGSTVVNMRLADAIPLRLTVEKRELYEARRESRRPCRADGRHSTDESH